MYDVRTKQKKTMQRRISWLRVGRCMVRIVPTCWRKRVDIWRLCVLSGKHDRTILSVIYTCSTAAKHWRATSDVDSIVGSRGHKAAGGNPLSWNRYGTVRGLQGSTSYKTAERWDGKTKNRNVIRAALISRPTTTDVYAEWPSSLWNVRVNRGKKSSRETNERKSRRYPARPVRSFIYKNTMVSYGCDGGRGGGENICSKKRVNFRCHRLYYI